LSPTNQKGRARIAAMLERFRKDPELANCLSDRHRRIAAFAIWLQRQNKARAYRFLPTDMTGKFRGPWQVGEMRSVAQRPRWWDDFSSSPTLWEALQCAKGPVACLFEVSGYRHERRNERGAREGFSNSCKLLAASDISRELRSFAADCAERALRVFEHAHPEDHRARRAVEAARALALGAISAAEARAESLPARIASALSDGRPLKEQFALLSVLSAVEPDAGIAARDAAKQTASTASWAFSPFESSEFAAASEKGAALPIFLLAMSPDAGEAEREWQRNHFSELVTAPLEEYFDFLAGCGKTTGFPLGSI